jgi:hypothetical protein
LDFKFGCLKILRKIRNRRGPACQPHPPLKRAPLPHHRARHVRPCCRATFRQPPPCTVADRCLRPQFPRRLFVDQRPRNRVARVHLTSIRCRTEAKPISPSSPLPFPATRSHSLLHSACCCCSRRAVPRHTSSLGAGRGSSSMEHRPQHRARRL